MKKSSKTLVLLLTVIALCAGLFPSTTLAASNIGVTLNTSKDVISSTNAVLHATILNPQQKKITDVGIQIAEQNTGRILKTHTEKCNPSATTWKSVSMWFDLNKELNITLSPGTQYTYTMFAYIGGQRYTAAGAFATPSQSGTIAPVKNAKVTSAYGWRTLKGVRKFHYGTDIVGDKTVMSIANGTVVSTGYDKVGGNYVCVKHTDGYVSCYFHLASIAVSKNTIVVQGQKIGVMGKTGTGAQGVHLHLEIRTKWQGSLYATSSWSDYCINPTTYVTGIG